MIFGNKDFINITFLKFQIIYENLKKNKYVCFTDGDIIFKNNRFLKLCYLFLGNNELFIQNDSVENKKNNLCSGFMFIKSNKNTLNLFNPKNINYFNKDTYLDDHGYLNSIKHKLKYKKLPLELFPNGKVFYENYEKINKNNLFLIHFNWCKSNEKKDKMKKYNCWYI